MDLKKNFLINKLEERMNSLSSLNSRLEELKKKYSNYEEFYNNKIKFFSQSLNKEILNTHLNLKFKDEKIYELATITNNNVEKTNVLQEQLLQNRNRIINVNANLKEFKSKAERSEFTLGFLLKKELYKKGLLVLIALILFILDFCLLLRKIRLL
jgi:hypothetical protein